MQDRMIEIKSFEKADVPAVVAFEQEVRRQEPDTYFWEPDEAYARQLEQSFADPRFNTAISYLAFRDGGVIGRIDASVISSRSDAACCSVYLDWICVLKSERHCRVAQALLNALRAECKKTGRGAADRVDGGERRGAAVLQKRRRRVDPRHRDLDRARLKYQGEHK